jgi:hypothetical protein
MIPVLDGAAPRAMVERMRSAMPRSVLRVVVRSLLLIGGAACGDRSLEPLPLSITVEASRVTAVVGETVEFVVSAQGGMLIGVEIDYADGVSDERGTSGARTARVTFRHAYTAAGTYQVRATVVDAVAGTKAASVEVHVQQADASSSTSLTLSWPSVSWTSLAARLAELSS